MKITKALKNAMGKIGLAVGLVLVVVLSFVPLPVWYGLSNVLAWMMSGSKSVKASVRQKLAQAFDQWTPAQVDAVCKKYVRCSFDYFFEFLCFSRLTKRQMRKRCVFKNMDLLLDSLATHKFVICYAGHMLNFEYLVSFPLMQDKYGMCQFFQWSHTNMIQDWFIKSRGKYGAISIPSKSPLRPIERLNEQMDKGQAERSGYVLGTLADMDSFGQNPHKVRFFNGEIEVLTGSEKVGRKYGMDFFYAKILRPKRGRYEVEFQKIAPKQNPAEYEFAYTDEYIRLLEDNIREQPEIWMPWGSTRL